MPRNDPTLRNHVAEEDAVLRDLTLDRWTALVGQRFELDGDPSDMTVTTGASAGSSSSGATWILGSCSGPSSTRSSHRREVRRCREDRQVGSGSAR